jgi:hypothetical protein
VVTRQTVSLVCDLHGSEDILGAAPVWLGIGAELYQWDACPRCEDRLREALSPFLARARRAGALPSWLPRAGDPGGHVVSGPAAKRDLIISVIRARIACGIYPAGTYLPAQRDLAQEHGMSAQPVHDACWRLERAGLIRKTTRSRYIVQPGASARRAGDRRGSAAGGGPSPAT